jgi:hypothetical protein
MLEAVAVQDEAFVDVQANITDCPSLIVDACVGALKVTVVIAPMP